MPLQVTTHAFTPGGTMPSNFTGEGADKSPAIHWEGAPAGTQSFALIVEDPDAPGETFVHWLVYDIPGSVNHLDPGLHQDEVLDDGIKQGINDFGRIGYNGPLPPPGPRHQYVFRVYALSKPVGELKPGMKKDDFYRAIDEGGILERAEITVFYKRFGKVKKAV